MNANDAKKADEGRHRGLGRGLSALIGDEAAARSEGPARAARILPVVSLRPNRFQPRKNFEASELHELAQSIREKGLLQPILVRPVAGEANAFEIVAGERRWRAAQLAQLHDVPAVVRELNDAEALEFAIIENVQRADLNAMEEATADGELIGRFGYTQERLAQEVGKSRSHVANTLRLRKLPESVQTMIREGRLTAGHARTLIGAADPEARAHQIVASELSVRQAERRSQNKSRKPAVGARKDADTRALEASLTNLLGLKVEIVHKGSTGGELRLFYRTLEQLDDIIRRLNEAR